MRVIQPNGEIIDCTVEEYQQLKGTSHTVIVKAPITLPDQDVSVEGRKSKKYSRAERQRIKDFAKQPENHYTNGKIIPTNVESLAKELGRTRTGILSQLWTNGYTSVKGTKRQQHKRKHKETIPSVKASFRAKKWTKELIEKLKQTYPTRIASEIAKDYGTTANAIRQLAQENGIKKDPIFQKMTNQENARKARETRLATKHDKHEPPMLRRKAISPIAPPIPVDDRFPELIGTDCTLDTLKRTFQSLAKKETEYLSLEGAGTYVLGIKGEKTWSDFILDALKHFPEISRILNVKNKYRVGMRQTKQVICYG